uniref:Secreted protein n=1 Tax=Knipowitschia caucasica TaxID=637954 RepID=A0AAV2L687_KNICA
MALLSLSKLDQVCWSSCFSFTAVSGPFPLSPPPAAAAAATAAATAHTRGPGRCRSCSSRTLGLAGAREVTHSWDEVWFGACQRETSAGTETVSSRARA